MAATYRSYVIRVRRLADGRDAVRLDVEDLIGGGHAAIVGDEARTLAERLLSMVAGAGGDPAQAIDAGPTAGEGDAR
jgi:hypothetical protein